jgi:hypothetical protein
MTTMMNRLSLNQSCAVAVSFAAIVSVGILVSVTGTTYVPADRTLRRSSRPVPIELIHRLRSRMTPEQVHSILGAPDGFFFSFSREEYYGDWTIEYFLNERGELRLGSIRSERFGELLAPSRYRAAQASADVRR